MLSTWAALLGLTLTIFLIFKKVHPVYALIIGPVVGSLAGGLTLQEILPIMVEGSKNMIPAVLRILAAGILAGVLIDSGAATKLAKEIVRIFGNNFSILALALSTMLLTSIGVFVDVAVITVAPIALATAKKSNISVMAVNSKTETVNLNGLASGLYMLNVKFNEGSITKKIFVK